MGISVLARVWGNPQGSSNWPEPLSGTGTNLRAGPGKTGMVRGQGQNKRIRHLGPRENLLEGWVIFNPTCYIPGTIQESGFKHKLCIRMNKDRKGAQKNENSLICRAFSIMDGFFFLPLFRGLLKLLQFCSGNKSKIYVDLHRDEKSLWKDVIG